MLKIVNKIGLEAEYLLFNKKEELVLPQVFGYETDDLPILGEVRAKPGETREDAVGNFFTVLSQLIHATKQDGLKIGYGYADITPQFKAEILREMGTKTIQDIKNIYKTDILSLSDDTVVDGVVVSCRISCGLHIHFSREVLSTVTLESGKMVTDKKFLITDSQIKSIVRTMDKLVLPNHQLGVPLKYRKPGYYEKKDWGFEYRSLPMYPPFVKVGELTDLVDTAFTLLERLGK